jgi:hypothetical protein
MNRWADRMLDELRDKAVELRRQLAGIEAAIKALEAGYDTEPLDYPAALTRIEKAVDDLKHDKGE